MTKKKQSDEYLERKELIELQSQRDIDKHARKMKELEYIRETDKLHHERDMERNRVKSAEIRKMQERKEMSRNFRNEERLY